jgi:hypothetical protein
MKIILISIFIFEAYIGRGQTRIIVNDDFNNGGKSPFMSCKLGRSILKISGGELVRILR